MDDYKIVRVKNYFFESVKAMYRADTCDEL
jgi:hypothetical protein